MRRHFAITIGFLLVLIPVIPVGLHLASSEPGLNLPINTSAGVTATINLGMEDPAGLVTLTQAGTATTYSDGNYQIQVIQTATKARTILRVIAKKMSGEPFRMDTFSITVRVPKNSIGGIWYPGADSSSTDVMVTDANHSIDDVADANFGIPYIAAATSGSKNVVALGLGRQDLAVSISGQPIDRSSYEFRLKALSSRTAATFDERFYISTDGALTWFDTAANYADWADSLSKYQPFPISDRAYEPLYDAWYWTGDRVNDALYQDTAKVAADVGLGLYLADSGWDTDTGEYEKWLDGKTGDYSPPPDKFQDLAQTFNEIRNDDHLGIDLWLQPFAVGRGSTRYSNTSNIHIQVPENRYPSMGWGGLTYPPFTLPLGNNLENVNLCPRMSATEAYLKNLFTDVATKYNPDGYWLDFIDGMPTYCIAGHRHNYALFGEGFKRSLETIKATILAYNPEAIVHFRARYANLNTKPYANVWQSGDSPGDFDRMRLNSVRLHPFSKGVVFAADQMFWPEGTSEAQVAKFIVTSVMIGVPAFGPTLIYSPPETLAMMKAWVTFYRTYKTDIARGKFSPFGQLKMPNHKIEGQDRTFVYLRNLDFEKLAANGKTVFLINATDDDQLTARVRVPAGPMQYSVRVFDRFLAPDGQEMNVTLDSTGVLNLNVAVEQGGMAVLTPQKESPATHDAGDP